MSVTAGRLRLPVPARSAPGRLARAWQAWVRAGTRRTPAFVLLVTVVGVLNVIGLVMVLSASTVTSLDAKGSAWWFFQRQLVWMALGVVGFVVASRVDYRRWRRIASPLLGVALALLVLVLVPGIGVGVDGAQRWLGAGPFRFQPSEVAKIALLVFTADLLTRREHSVADWRRVVRPVVIVFGVVGTLVMLEPDLGTTMILALCVGAVLVVGGLRWRDLAALAALGAGAVGAFALAVPWRRARLLTFLHPWSDRSNTGYQITQSLIAVGSGGWTGVGLGASRAKWRFLPAAHTDFIFAIVAEELGLVGAVLVVGLFVAFAVLGARIALRAPDRFGTLLAAGITAWTVGQAFMNLGMVVGILPVSGNTLPFVSFGGSSLLFGMIGAGLLANIARQGTK